jgi:hypothetical protein
VNGLKPVREKEAYAEDTQSIQGNLTEKEQLKPFVANPIR